MESNRKYLQLVGAGELPAEMDPCSWGADSRIALLIWGWTGCRGLVVPQGELAWLETASCMLLPEALDVRSLFVMSVALNDPPAH